MMPPLTTQQAADYIGISIKTVQEQIRLGAIPAVKLGRAWFISRTAATYYRDNQKGRPGRKYGK